MNQQQVGPEKEKAPLVQEKAPICIDVPTETKPAKKGLFAKWKEAKEKAPICIDVPTETKPAKKGLFAKWKEAKEEAKKKPPQVSMFAVLRFAPCGIRFLFALGVLFAVVSGAGMPFFCFIFQKLLDSLASENPAALVAKVGDFAVLAIFVGCCMLVTCWIFTTCFMMAGDLLGARIRELLFTKMLLQELAWFDSYKPGELTSWLTTDMLHLEDALGEKLGQFLFNACTALMSVAYGFYVSWRLTLMILACSPLLIVAGTIMAVLMTKLSESESGAYATAGAIAQEVFANVRTVVSFNAQSREIVRFRAHLGAARTAGIKKGWTQALSIAFTMAVIFGTYALAFWYGSKLIDWGYNTGGEVVGCFFAVLMGCFMLGAAGPFASTVATAKETLTRVIGLLDRKSEIPLRVGLKPNKELSGQIALKNIRFRYPSRKNRLLFDGLDLEVQPGQRLALVGHSGGGKSSVLALVERFYDAEVGDIYVDGYCLKELDVEWWRKHISYVTQEPQLFSCSIKENLELGVDRKVTMEELQQACMAANIHTDIMALDDQYDTQVGESGSQLSGGQRQRICIARALLANPRILLLDEATSALDRQSERLVQDALEKLMKGRTTIVIAHRLVTIQDADLIAFVQQGKAVGAPPNQGLLRQGTDACSKDDKKENGDEEDDNQVRISPSKISEIGTHDELMALGGEYFAMVQAQRAVEVDVPGHDDAPLTIDTSVRTKPELGTASTPVTGGTPTTGKSMRDSFSAAPVGGEKKKEKQKKRWWQSNKKKEEGLKGGLVRVAKLNAPEWPYLALGMIGAAASALIYPIYAILFSQMINAFYPELWPSAQAREDDIRKWALFFLGMAAYAFVANLLRTAMFAIAGEKLTYRLRDRLMAAILRQDMEFFDKKDNESGNLCNVLSKDVPQVHIVFGPTLAMYIQNMLTLVAGLLISFIVLWKLALITLALVPFMVFAAAINIVVMQGFGDKSAGVFGAANHIATETIQSIRIVTAFNMQERRVFAYRRTLVETTARAMTRALIAGFFLGFNQLCMFAVFGVAFWYGAKLIQDDPLNVDFKDVMTCTTALIFAGMGVGETSALAKSFGNAGASAKRVFDILDRVPQIDIDSTLGQLPSANCGALGLKDVNFVYPSRPDQKILKTMSLAVPKGKHLALIGATGCGKSTVMQLIQRFYDPKSGQVIAGDRSIQDLNLHDWRAKMAIVSQEPVLFDETIRYNIAYGSPEATDDQIHEAAKIASIHNDIMAFPEGYYTKVGLRGGQLSGGQRQRVAIARAILQKPAILLLDEATAALDNISEAEVQKALDNIIQNLGMTVVTIAHRLTTIQNADLIAVLHAGKLLEIGSHEELYHKNGEYRRRYDLYHGRG